MALAASVEPSSTDKKSMSQVEGWRDESKAISPVNAEKRLKTRSLEAGNAIPREKYLNLGEAISVESD